MQVLPGGVRIADIHQAVGPQKHSVEARSVHLTPLLEGSGLAQPQQVPNLPHQPPRGRPCMAGVAVTLNLSGLMVTGQPHPLEEAKAMALIEIENTAIAGRHCRVAWTTGPPLLAG